MLDVVNLTKIYPVHYRAVDNVSFTVQQADVLGLLGPNGAGKTTILKVITGFVGADQGTVSILNKDIVNDRIDCLSSIGYVPEHAPLYNDLTCEEYLSFVKNIRAVKDSSAIDRVIDLCQLEDYRRQIIMTLSNGLRRRVSLAQALIHDPSVLILDEPTAGLDPYQNRQFFSMLSTIKQDKAVVISTHNLQQVQENCNKVLLIGDGKILYLGEVEQWIDENRGKDLNQLFFDLAY